MARSHDEVAHAWANQTHETMRGCNVFFEGGTIYSYGKHFPIARIVQGTEFAKAYANATPVVLSTSKDYSVSTSKHKSIVARACNHYRTFTVPNVSLIARGCDYAKKDSQLFHDENIDHYREVITTAYGKASRAHKYGKHHLTDAERAIDAAKDYIGVFTLPKRARRRIEQIEALRISDAERDCIVNKANQWEANTLAREEIRAKALEEKHRDAVIEWQAGERRDLPHGIRKVYLRKNPKWWIDENDTVQTSWGARVPLDDARLLYRFTKNLRQIGWSSESSESFDVGGFPLNRVNEHGIVVGCHRIAWNEIDRFAAQEGWAA